MRNCIVRVSSWMLNALKLKEASLVEEKKLAELNERKLIGIWEGQEVDKDRIELVRLPKSNPRSKKPQTIEVEFKKIDLCDNCGTCRFRIPCKFPGKIDITDLKL